MRNSMNVLSAYTRRRVTKKEAPLSSGPSIASKSSGVPVNDDFVPTKPYMDPSKLQRILSMSRNFDEYINGYEKVEEMGQVFKEAYEAG